jgi:hypothetical protein
MKTKITALKKPKDGSKIACIVCNQLEDADAAAESPDAAK